MPHPISAPLDPGIAAYGRLSRDDEKDKSIPMADKIALRKEILKYHARYAADIELQDEQVVFEIKSGGNLDDRPGLLGLLERCAAGLIHTLIIFDIDRLTRDVGDWKRIEKALFRGRVRLITSRGTYEFTPNFDPTLLQILAVLGEKERRSVSFRRKATNVQRARQGALSVGYAPYGYRWDKTARRYFVDPDEYGVVVYIFGRIWEVGTNSIANELNAKGVTPPGVGRREQAAVKWLKGTVANMIRNPFYAGRPAKRKEVDRDGALVTLPAAQWIWAEAEEIRYPLPDDEEGQAQWETLPHPITMAQWEQLQELLRERTFDHRPTKGLLTGLLTCSEGRKMHMHRPHYHCVCEEHGVVHRGHAIKQDRLDALVTALVADVIDALPVTTLKPTPKARADDSAALAADVARTRRQLREKEETLADLVARASFYQSLPRFGVKGHKDTLEAVSKEAEGLAAKLAELESKQQQPALRLASPLLAQVRARGGAQAFFAQAPVPLQRELIHFVVKSVCLDPIADGQGMTRSVRVTLYPLEEGKGEQTRCVPIAHPRQGVTRGPYATRKKTQENP